MRLDDFFFFTYFFSVVVAVGFSRFQRNPIVTARTSACCIDDQSQLDWWNNAVMRHRRNDRILWFCFLISIAMLDVMWALELSFEPISIRDGETWDGLCFGCFQYKRRLVISAEIDACLPNISGKRNPFKYVRKVSSAPDSQIQTKVVKKPANQSRIIFIPVISLNI